MRRRLGSALLWLAVGWILGASPAVAPAAAAQNRVFASTDIAAGLVGGWRSGPADVDDAWAVELLGLFGGAKLEGAAVVRGNDILAPELFAARQIFRKTRGRWTGPILAGGVEALPTPDTVTWVGGRGSPVNLTSECENPGVRRLAKLLRTRGPLTLLAIGPLTDVACLVLTHPKLAARITELVFLGGRAPDQVLALPGSDVTFTDFNFAQDVRAAEIVLGSTIPLTFITFSLSSSTIYPTAEVARLGTAACSPRARVLSRASQPRIQYYWDDLGVDGLLAFDVNAAYYVARPELFDCADGGWVLVPCTVGTPGVYDGPDNPCAGHGPDQSSGLNAESVQLWTDPSLLGQSRLVRVCTGYRDAAARELFLTQTLDVICRGRRWR
jgi:inosine-uridine nucleoside N-ribohydrolase